MLAQRQPNPQHCSQVHRFSEVLRWSNCHPASAYFRQGSAVARALTPATASNLCRKQPALQRQKLCKCLVRTALQVCASSYSRFGAGSTPDTATLPLEELGSAIVAQYNFSRPHTMLGTFFGVCSVSLLALGSAPMTSSARTGLLQALAPALLMNICIVGINQLFDIEIDKVNKPYLPLASGAMSVSTAVATVLVTGAASLFLGLTARSPPLLATLIGSLVLGIAYSTDLPFLRWKQYPVVAAGCILSVRAILVQLGFYFHMKQATGMTALTLTRPLVFAMSFMLVFSIVIALFKDIPDVKGDSQAGLKTFSVRVGVQRVFWACIMLLETAYMGAVAFGLTTLVPWSRYCTIAAHACLGALLFNRAKQTDLSSSKSIYSCYMFCWKLFYTEYLLIPLLR